MTTDFLATNQKLLEWTMEIHNRVNYLQNHYRKLKYAVGTGEGDPNGIRLTADQKAELEAEMTAVETEILAFCSAHNVELVEIPEVEEEESGN